MIPEGIVRLFAKVKRGTRYVPSENVFVDRKLLWTSQVFMSFQAVVDAGVAPVTIGQTPIAVPGRDFALCALPLNSLCSTMSATINDTTSVINTQDVLKEVLRLTDYKPNRLQRTCPTMLDKYLSYNDAYQTLNNPLGGYESSTDYDNVPNGAFYGLQFTTPTGTPLAAIGSVASAYTFTSGGVLYNVASNNGVPVFGAALGAPPLAQATPTGVAIPIYITWRSTEPLVLSPFVFADEHEWDTGLFGINNIQLIMNLLSSPARVIRSTDRAGVSISAIQYNATAPQAFVNSKVNVQFLTPSLEVPLPPKSVVPYMEFPRYITAGGAPLDPGQTRQIQSQTITLPQIPDLLMIYCKPLEALDSKLADFYFPIADGLSSGSAPLSINFDNFSGLLSSHTVEELYAMSVKNGLCQDFNAWLGQAHSAAGNWFAHTQGAITPLTGGMLVLKPSQDITLQSGQAPSLVGNFTLQFNITVKNNAYSAFTPMLYVVTANSGFFESIRGSSRIIKGVLSEQDIINAPTSPMILRDQLDRMVGGLSFGKLGSMLSKVKGFYEKTKPIVSAVRGALPEDGAMGRVKGALGAVGYGVSGGAGRAPRGLASRLM